MLLRRQIRRITEPARLHAVGGDRRLRLRTANGCWVSTRRRLATNAQEYDPLENLDAQDVRAWLDNYCHTHPLVSRAIVVFVAAHPQR